MINICITFDYEGHHLRNINDLKILRKHLQKKNIPVSHFICPAYFVKNNNKTWIKDLIYVEDEVHLHLHPIKQLVKAAGINFRKENNYYHNRFPNNLFVNGRGVPISSYKKEEQEKLILFSLDLLKNVFPEKQIIGFRAGGNIINDTTLSILKKHFKFDSSFTSPFIYSRTLKKNEKGYLKDYYNSMTGIFGEMLIELYGGKDSKKFFLKNKTINSLNKYEPIKMDRQPFFINDLLELPENCGTTDFVNPEKVVSIIEDLYNNNKFENKDLFVNYGVHNEGLAMYKSKLIDFIKLIDLKEINYTTLSKTSHFNNK